VSELHQSSEFRAHFDGQVLVPDEPVELPIGTPLMVSAAIRRPTNEPLGGTKPLAKLAKLLAEIPPNPDAAPDAAIQHDHYLYGTPKR
jgi:hypothetical protein